MHEPTIPTEGAAPANAPAMFAVLVLPYAFTASVTSLLTPYLLRTHGVPVDQIAGIVAIANLPTIWSFFWSPIADSGWSKRFWIGVSAFGAAMAAFEAITNLRGPHALLTALLFLMNAFAGLLSASCGALLTAVPSEMRGHAAGWYQGANLGATALGGALLIWLADRMSLSALALLCFAAMLIPVLALVRIAEPPATGRLRAGEFFGDIREVFRQPLAWIGFVFLLSPVGSAAVGQFISGMGPDYRASGTEVAWVTGVASGLFSALGALIGGVFADKIGRFIAYPFAGAMACVFAIYMGFAGATPLTLALGYSGYSLAAGIAYAVYTAIVLDILGKRKHAPASSYAILNSAGNFPIAYMTWIDGLAYGRGGVRGAMTTDAVANGGFGVLLFGLAMLMRRRWKREE